MTFHLKLPVPLFQQVSEIDDLLSVFSFLSQEVCDLLLETEEFLLELIASPITPGTRFASKST